VRADQTHPFAVPGGQRVERLFDEEGKQAGALIREWKAIEGAFETTIERVKENGYKLSIRIINASDIRPQSREDALRHSLISTHTILWASGAEFVSLLEPPEPYVMAAAACENEKTWPVLVGEPGDRHTLLSAPISLYDYPDILPEGPEDRFDGPASDESGCEILERTESLSPEDLSKLSSIIRSLQALRRGSDGYVS
jgi:hydrogenase maturation protease